MSDKHAAFSYCVAIRTLGKAGDMYRRELVSLAKQTIPPRKILVYIAEGYEIPKETIGCEQYIRIQKGMVAQRVLPSYDEVDSSFLLLLDDDVYLPPDCVERLYKGLMENDGDCIAADVFREHEQSRIKRLHGLITNWACPRKDDEWAFKILPTGAFSYNSHPNHAVCLSESAAGPCALWKISAFRAIHPREEMWMDKLGFAYGEDLLLSYKLYRNGFRLLVHYDSGAVHLDAQSARKDYKADKRKMRLRSMGWFLIWWRTQYSFDGTTVCQKVWLMFVFWLRFLYTLGLMILLSIATFSVAPMKMHILGTIDGWRYVHSGVYRQVPNFNVRSSNA